jgi:hypothetical protein
MRKLIGILVATVMAVSTVGCGGGGGDSGASSVGGGGQPPANPNPPPPATGLGSATISWTAPNQNTDGSALNNLAGYEIRYGQNVSALDSYVTIDGVGSQTRVIENLTSGTWYFSISARNSSGVLSNPSSPVSKVIS